MNRPAHKAPKREALTPGTLIAGGHRISTVLGKGGFGITYKATDNDGQPVAIKEYFPEGAGSRKGQELVILPSQRADFKAGYQYFWDEAETLRKLPPHPNIVGVKNFFGKNRTIYIIMDFVDGVALAKQIRDGRHFDNKELTNLLGEITVALGHLHDQEVLHLDIKPQNIMMRHSTGKPVLIDFGAARNFSQTDEQIEILTEGYAPIELIDPSLGNPGPWSDIYSLGVVAYWVATGVKPPSSAARVAALRKNQPDPLVPCLRRKRSPVSNDIAKVIDACLNLIPGDRPLSAGELLTLLRGGARLPTPTTQYGSPSKVSLAQITRSMKILQVIQVVPIPQNASFEDGAQRIESQSKSQQPQTPTNSKQTKPTNWGETASLAALSFIALGLIAVIAYVLATNF